MAPSPDALHLLKQTDYFKGVSEKSRKLLSSICIPKHLKKKETLFAEGDKGFAVYLCGSGTLQLSKLHPDGRETVIRIIEPGEMFGEVILFENDTYPVTAVALTRAMVYVLPKHQFNCLLNNESFRNDFISGLMKKLRFLADQILNLTTRTAEERFLRFIVNHYGPKKEYRITLSKKDIASAIGANPETLSRVLASLKAKGAIAFDGKTMRLTNLTTI